MSKPNIAEDRRLDPRIKAVLAAMPAVEMQNFDGVLVVACIEGGLITQVAPRLIDGPKPPPS